MLSYNWSVLGGEDGGKPTIWYPFQFGLLENHFLVAVRECAFDYVVTVTVRTRPTGRAKNYDVSFRYSEIRRPVGQRKNIMMCHFNILKMHRRFDGMIGVREDLVKLLARS